MANVTTTNPIILDTAVDSWADLDLPNNQPLFVKKIIFTAAAAKDTAVITNSDSSVAWQATGAVAGDNQYDFNPSPLILSATAGWFLSSMSDSGTLQIFFN